MGLYAVRSKIYSPDNDTIVNKVRDTLSRLFKSDIDTPSTSQNTTPSNKSFEGNDNIDMNNFFYIVERINFKRIIIAPISYFIENAKGDKKVHQLQPAKDVKAEDKIVEVNF